MTITMQNAERLTLTEMQEFVEGSQAVQWTACGREPIYDFLRRVLEAHPYQRLSKSQKGIVRRILQREHRVFDKPEYERLAQIPASHIYNLRHAAAYGRHRVQRHPTRARHVPITERGQRKRRYPVNDYRTPYEKLLSLPHGEQFLKPGVTAPCLHSPATRHSDTDAARRMQRAQGAVLAQGRRSN